MKKFIVIIFILFLFIFATACTDAGGSEPSVAPRPTQDVLNLEDRACTDAGDGRSLGLFPQEENQIMINGFDLPPGSQPTLRLIAVDDENGRILDAFPTVNDEGMFSETITLPETDYTRWNIRLVDGDEMLCYYIIMSQGEWLEMGNDGAPEDTTALEEDMALAAEDTGIPIEQLEQQSANEDAMTELAARLNANETDTFGGLWIEWEPAYKIVVGFTENGEETVAKYLDADSPLYDVLEIRNVAYTQAELMADQAELMDYLQDTAVTFSYGSGIQVQNNSVYLELPSQSVWEEQLAEHPYELPPSIVVEYAFEDVIFEPPTALNPVPDVYMPQQKLPSLAFMEALLVANLVVQDNCLMAQDPESSEELTLIIWEPGYFLHDNDGTLQVLDENGDVVAQEGELMYMGGGSGGAPNEAALVAPIPDRCSIDNIWYMGQFLPEEYRD